MTGREFARSEWGALNDSPYDSDESREPGCDYDYGLPGDQEAASQPILLLLMAMLCVIAAVGLLYFLWDGKAANVAAWVLAGPIAITCLGLFLGADARRRAATAYYTRVWSGWAYRVTAVAAIAASAVASWAMAQWLVRL